MNITWPIGILLLLLSPGTVGQQQLSEEQLLEVGNRYTKTMQSKYDYLSNLMEKRNRRFIDHMKRCEKRLIKKIKSVDSQNHMVLENVDSLYSRNVQQNTAANTISNFYSGFLDTVSTSIAFLKTKLPENSAEMLRCERILQNLKGTLDRNEQIEQFIESRREQWKKLLRLKGELPSDVKKEYLNLSKKAIYYRAQVREYRQILEDPAKGERKALQLLQELPAFQKFMRENSELASLFRITGSAINPADIAGLQTRASVEDIIQQRIATIGENGSTELRQQFSTAVTELQKLKDNIDELTGENKDFELPEFKPNSQKTKAFLDRVEYGFDVQFGRGSSLVPTTANMGLTAGYKLNDKSVIGLGIAYKMGIGSFEHLRISHEGLGLRSFLDWKLKKQMYVSGGWEMNHTASFKDLQQLQNLDAWQSSALLGMSKKYKLGKKTQGELKLLYDFLYRQHIPARQPLIFRFGYKL